MQTIRLSSDTNHWINIFVMVPDGMIEVVQQVELAAFESYANNEFECRGEALLAKLDDVGVLPYWAEIKKKRRIIMLLKRISENMVATAHNFDEANNAAENGAKGIVLGARIDPKTFGNFASFEVRDGKPVLLLNDSELKRFGIEVMHVDSDWNIKG